MTRPWSSRAPRTEPRPLPATCSLWLLGEGRCLHLSRVSTDQVLSHRYRGLLVVRPGRRSGACGQNPPRRAGWCSALACPLRGALSLKQMLIQPIASFHDI